MMDSKQWSILTDIELSETKLKSEYNLVKYLAGELMESAEDVGASTSKALCFSERAFNSACMILTALDFMGTELNMLAEQTKLAFDNAKKAEP